MYEAYFTQRLLEALALADSAPNAEVRSAHIRALGYYRGLLENPEKRHSVRYPTRIGAMVHHIGAKPFRVVVSNLSRSGFRMELPVKVRPGRAIRLAMDGLLPVDAYVVWQDDDQVGCKFVNELHPALVDAAIAVSPLPD